ncbi:histidine ammonia-lyase [Gilvibacter sp.]|uniref:histidine ammonia-lyase n=1 Tax=Gilvibacter sp. TaxID=2729997 RepID=UPI003F49F30F
MEGVYEIGSSTLDLPLLQKLATEPHQLRLSEAAKQRIETAYDYLHHKMQQSKEPVYGINTGFGSLCNVAISDDKLTQLQENLVMSHACGIGEEVPTDIVKTMLLLKVQSLSYGHSGVALSTVELLMEFYNNEVFPVVYQQGSLGASGDLAPLAHLALPLLGKGAVYYQGERQDASEVLKELGLTPIKLQAKEGLALLNGTQFMSAYGVELLLKGYKQAYLADLIAALSVDAFDCNLSPFDPLVHLVRPHKGQINTAARILEFLDGSEIAASEKSSVQDPYSFRCVPQVHGATKDALEFASKTILTEINSVTDNPNIFVGEDRIISGGNFHGQPLALALDYLGIALAELANISERRTYQLVSGLRGLPDFLVQTPGLHSGFMIPQYTAASIVSQNKQLATPASVDSIVSSNGQEDHVSMGANAATKCYRIAVNVQKVLAIELMNASQALVFREPLKTAPFLASILELYRAEVPFVSEDRLLSEDIHASVEFLRSLQIDSAELY